MSRLRRYDALALTAGLWFLAKFVRYLFPPLFTTFEAEFGVTTATLGAAFGALMGAYALLQFPAGALADRVGGVRVIAAGTLVACAGAVAVALAGSLWPLVAGMVLVGAGTGTHKTVAVTLMAAVYPERTGRALGALDTLGALGGVGASAAVVTATALGGDSWRLAFVGVAALGVVGAALFARRVPRRVPGGAGGETPPVREYLTLLRRPRVATFVAAAVLAGAAYNGAVAFLPYYLQETGLSEATAGVLYGLLFAVSVVQPVTGEAADRVGLLPVVGATLGLATVGLGALLAVRGPLALGAAVAVLGAGAHGFRPVRGAYLVRLVPSAGAGGSLGVVRTALMGAGALAPAGVGVLAETAGLGVAFGALLATMGGALALVGALALDASGGF